MLMIVIINLFGCHCVLFVADTDQLTKNQLAPAGYVFNHISRNTGSFENMDCTVNTG